MLMTDPRIIVAIDTFDLKQANVILDQLDPDLCMIKIGSVVFKALKNSSTRELEISTESFNSFFNNALRSFLVKFMTLF